MKTQAEVLQHSELATDDMPGYKFSPEDVAFLAVAEGFISIEWEKACKPVGLKPNQEAIPANYDEILARQGRWTLEYASEI